MQTVEEYVNGELQTCPLCGTRLTVRRSVRTHKNRKGEFYDFQKCDLCGGQWVEEYRIVDIEEVIKGV